MATPTTLPATFVAGNVLTAAQMNNLRGAFRVLQVASTTKTDTFSTTSTSFTDVTGLSVAITPSATTSNILILGFWGVSSDGGGPLTAMRLLRGTTAICVGNAAGSRNQAAFNVRVDNSNSMYFGSVVFLDSPATTSSTTYKMQMLTSSGTSYLNRSFADADLSGFSRTASTILAMEISA